MLVSKKHWDKLPKGVRKVLKATAKEMQAFVYARAAELEIELLQNLIDGGITVNQADKAAFIAASGAIYDEFSSTVPGGADMIAKAMELAGGS